MAEWSRSAPATDRRLVKALHDAEDDAIAALFDLYAARLYDYCVALSGDPKSAADIVHDTVIDASRRAPRLRDREKLPAWLYAAARRRCLLCKRPAAMSEDGAFARLDFVHREALFLAYRHELTGEDLAAILGITARRAQDRLDQAGRQVPDARSLLGTAPVPEPPATLRHRVLHTGTDPELAGYRAEIAARGGALTPEGMPRQPDAPSRLARRWAFAGGGSVAALATTIVVLVSTDPHLPLPDLRWPGRAPHRPASSTSPTARPRLTGPAPASQPRTLPSTAPPGALPKPASPTSTRERTASPTLRPPTRLGALVVSPTSIHLTAVEKTGAIGLTAKGGAVTWTATNSDPELTLSSVSGTLEQGRHATVRVTLNRRLIGLPGRSTVTVTDGRGRSTPVTVTWGLSLV